MNIHRMNPGSSQFMQMDRRSITTTEEAKVKPEVPTPLGGTRLEGRFLRREESGTTGRNVGLQMQHDVRNGQITLTFDIERGVFPTDFPICVELKKAQKGNTGSKPLPINIIPKIAASLWRGLPECEVHTHKVENEVEPESTSKFVKRVPDLAVVFEQFMQNEREECL
jgi:hypothetical protein